jgi:hypothetical protein
MKSWELVDAGAGKGCDPCQEYDKSKEVKVEVLSNTSNDDLRADLVERAKRRHKTRMGGGTYFGLNWQDDPGALRTLLEEEEGEERLDLVRGGGIRIKDIKLEHELRGSLAMREVRQDLPIHIAHVKMDGKIVPMRVWPSGEFTPLPQFERRPDAHLGAVED